MSLICGAHENTVAAHYLLRVDEVFCVTAKASDRFTAVCRGAIDAIPANERSKTPLKDGIDIHFGHSAPNAPVPGRENNLSLRALKLGDWRFSITRKTAQRYLPTVVKSY